MGRIRSIKPELPQSESLSRVSRAARYLFTLLFTLADDDGRLRGNPAMLRRQLFPYDPEPDLHDHVEIWLGELDAKAKSIVRYSSGGDQYITILDWRESKDIRPDRSEWAQRVDHAYPSKLPAPPFANAREDSRGRTNDRDGAQEDLAGTTAAAQDSRMLANARESSRETPPQKREENQLPNSIREDSRMNASIREPSRSSLDLDHRLDPTPGARESSRGVGVIFETIWEARVERAGPDPKDSARREFMRLVNAGDDPEIVAAGMRRYFEANRGKAGTRYVARTDNALSDRLWEHYSAPRLVTPPTPPAAAPAGPTEPEDERWTRVRARLRTELGENVFTSWIAQVAFAALGHRVVLLVAPTKFLKTWIATHYDDALLRAWQAEDSTIRRVSVLARGIDPIVLPEPEETIGDVPAGKGEGVAAVEPRPAQQPATPPSAEQPATSAEEIARHAVDVDGIAQLMRYGRSRPQSIALKSRWLATIGGDYALMARLLGEVATLDLKEGKAVRWLEQQVKTHATQGVLPHTKGPVDVAKTRRPPPLVVPKRSASKRR